MKKHQWLTLRSMRTQPYRLEDISVIVPSCAKKFEKRWEWFWSQYVKNTNAKVVANTHIPCDKAEVNFLKKVTNNHKLIYVVEPRYIVPKTIGAIDKIRTRLTFRLANDIMVVRRGWEKPVLQRFNDIDKMQVIAKVTHGVSYPESQRKMAKDWKFIEREYKGKQTTAVVFPHGAILMAQTAVWRAYYTLAAQYTFHDHDEIFFSQIARGDGIIFTHMGGIDNYLAHVGITNQDFNEESLERLYELRKQYEEMPRKPGFRMMM